MNGRFNETWKPCGMKGSRIATATCQWASWQDSVLDDRTRAVSSRSRRGHTEEDVRICTLHDKRDVLLIRPSRVLTMRLQFLRSAVIVQRIDAAINECSVHSDAHRNLITALLQALYRHWRFEKRSLSRVRLYSLPPNILSSLEFRRLN